MSEYLINDSESFADFKEYLSQDNPKIIDVSPNKLITDYGTFSINDEYSSILDQFVKKESKPIENNSLIFGKDNTENIVSIECVENDVWLYKSDGSIEKRPNTFWILSDRRLDKNFKVLDGNNHYKYIRLFKSYKLYKKFRAIYNKKDIYVVWNDVEAAMIYHGFTLFQGMKLNDVKVMGWDIEASGLTRDVNSQVYLITNTVKQNGKILDKTHFRLDHYDNCAELIDDWCRYTQEQNPDIIVGHNVFGYDLDFLNHVAKLYGTKLYLGKDCSEAIFGTKPKKYRVDGSQVWEYKNCMIHGRHIIDTMFLAVKYDIGRKYPSWGLKPIIEFEGLVKEDRQFYDASKIAQNWADPKEREKIIEYGIDDSDDALNLFYLMVPSFFYMCQSIPKPFQVMVNGASGSWLNSIMVRSYLQELHSIPKSNESEYVAGGMSYGIAGVYDNVVKYDAASYYPSTILAFDIYDKQKDPKGYYLKMVRYFTNKRFEQKDMYKKTGDSHYDDLQASSKVFINSAYGLLGTPGLNFNSFSKAQLITKYCRAGLQKAVIWATGKDISYWWEDYKDKETSSQDLSDFSEIDIKSEWNVDEMPKHNWDLVNLDTDSLSFCKKDGSEFTKEEHDLIMDEINKIMYSAWEDDGEFERVVVVKAKNYVLKEKGSGKISYKGSSFKSATKEPVLKEIMHRIIEKSLIDETEDCVDIYHEYLKEAWNIKDISRWAIKKSITEKLMEANDTIKKKVLKALENIDFQIGDKAYLFQDIDGQRQKIVKCEPVFLKSGEAKMIDNDIYRRVEDFTGTYDKWHYVKRIYATVKILESVIDMDKIPKYQLKKNMHLLEERFNE